VKREESKKRDCIAFITGGGRWRKSSVLRVPRQFPLVHLVKVGWRQSSALGSEVGGLFGCEAG